jgi:hypothetical protein
VNFKRAEAIVSELELDVDDIAICLACLRFFWLAIDRGDEHAIRRETNRTTPDLWTKRTRRLRRGQSVGGFADFWDKRFAPTAIAT